MSFDSTEANKRFKDGQAFPYDLLSDLDKSASIAYGVATAEDARTPRRSVLIGPDGNVARSYATVKPADHPDRVLADLDALSG